jgi:hypothetical protein
VPSSCSSSWATCASTPLLRRFGFRVVLIAAIVGGLLANAACGLLWRSTPLAAVAALLVVGGAFRSVGFTAYNTIAFADIDAAEVTHANTLSSTLQQLAAGLGVAAGALALRLGDGLRGPLGQRASLHLPYTIAFALIAALLVPALVETWRLPRSAGAAIGGGAGRGSTSMRNVQ